MSSEVIESLHVRALKDGRLVQETVVVSVKSSFYSASLTIC